MRILTYCIVPSTILLLGCATQPSAKPLLTADASARIAQRCGAITSEFHQGQRKLPYATFVLRNNEAASQDGLAPTVRCIGSGLDGFRHSMMSFRYADESAG